MTQTLPAPLDVKLMNLTASVLFVGCVLLVLAAGAWWVLRYPGFAIARIVVQGELVHNNAVTLRANVAPHLVGNFFTVDLRAAREAFEQVPWVRRAQVRRVYPGSLRVELQEHDAVAYWGPDTGSALVNSQGEVFEANVGDVVRGRVVDLQGRALLGDQHLILPDGAALRDDGLGAVEQPTIRKAVGRYIDDAHDARRHQPRPPIRLPMASR